MSSARAAGCARCPATRGAAIRAGVALAIVVAVGLSGWLVIVLGVGLAAGPVVACLVGVLLAVLWAVSLAQ